MRRLVPALAALVLFAAPASAHEADVPLDLQCTFLETDGDTAFVGHLYQLREELDYTVLVGRGFSDYMPVRWPRLRYA